MTEKRIMIRFLNQFIYPALSGLVIALLVILFAPNWLGLPQISVNNMLNRGEQLLGIGEVSFSSAVKIAAPAVVNIATATLVNDANRSRMPKSPFTENNLGRAKVETSLGSGVIISPDGYLLTNNHVIEGADRIVAVLKDGREESASIVGRDPETDLAVLKIDLKDLPNLNLANSGQTEVGDVVLAIGNPFGLGQTVTMGIISATGRNDLSLNTYEDFIQTDAAINVGNSGEP